MPDQRGQLLRAALGFAGLPRFSYDRALCALRTWLDSWSGIGHVAVGMHRQGFDLQLTQYDERGWRATFYTTGMEHSPTIATGTASSEVIARDCEGYVAKDETSQYEAGPTRRWLKVKQKGWTDAEVRWQRVMSQVDRG